MNISDAPRLDLYAKVPLRLIDDVVAGRLSATDVLVYAFMDARAGRRGWWYGSLETIGTGVAVTKSTAFRAIKRLRDLGYMTTETMGLRHRNQLRYNIVARLEALAPAPTETMEGVGAGDNGTERSIGTGDNGKGISIVTGDNGAVGTGDDDKTIDPGTIDPVETTDPDRHSDPPLAPPQAGGKDLARAERAKNGSNRKRDVNALNEIEPPAAGDAFDRYQLPVVQQARAHHEDGVVCCVAWPDDEAKWDSWCRRLTAINRDQLRHFALEAVA